MTAIILPLCTFCSTDFVENRRTDGRTHNPSRAPCTTVPGGQDSLHWLLVLFLVQRSALVSLQSTAHLSSPPLFEFHISNVESRLGRTKKKKMATAYGARRNGEERPSK